MRSRNGRLLAVSAAALAAAALYNTYRARKAEREHPPSGHFVTVDGVRLHYLERGVGAPTVLLHGNLVIAEDFIWSGVFDQAAARHRVIAFDRPGYGYSDRPRGSPWSPAEQAELLCQAFARLGIVRPVVVGHSWGALVALALALNHPDAVRGLVLLSGYYAPVLRGDALLSALPAVPAIGDVLRYALSPLLGSALQPLALKAVFALQPVPERFARQFPHRFPVRPAQIRAEAQDSATMMPAALGMRERYRDLRLPTVILAGTEDRVVDHERHSVWLHQSIPDSTLRLVDGVGHMIHYAVPDQVAAAIEAVANRTGDLERNSRGTNGRTSAAATS